MAKSIRFVKNDVYFLDRNQGVVIVVRELKDAAKFDDVQAEVIMKDLGEGWGALELVDNPEKPQMYSIRNAQTGVFFGGIDNCTIVSAMRPEKAKKFTKAEAEFQKNILADHGPFEIVPNP